MTSTRNYQAFLGKLYTDTSFREAFFVNPKNVQTIYQLDDIVVERLIGQKQAIERFADSLIRKRTHAVCNLLPLTRYFLGDSFHTHFRSYALAQHTDGIHRYHTDAVKFMNYLEQKVLPTQENQLLLKDIITLERTRNQIWENPHQSIICVARLNHSLAYLSTPSVWNTRGESSKVWWLFVRYKRFVIVDSVF